jgi:dynein heavy chain
MRESLEIEVQRMKAEFQNAIGEYQGEIKGIRKYSGSYEIKEANEEIDRIIERGKELTATLDEINRREELLGYQVTEFPKLEESIASYKQYEDLWRLARRYYTQSEAWNKTLAFNLDAEAMDKEIGSMNSLSFKLNNLLNSEYERDVKAGRRRGPLEGPNKMIDTLKKEIGAYKEYMPVVTVFSNPGMRERHWERASKHISVTINREQNWTFKRVMDIDGILQNSKALNDISDEAFKEYAIENILNKMLADWQPVNVELKAWKDTGSFIVSGGSVEEIQQILDDQMVKTQTMKGSPFAKIFEERIVEWESWLNFTLEFTELWIKVQGIWVYLEPIFSSPDITKHLPNEAVKFKEVDSEWKGMMAKINSQPRALEFTKNREFLESLKESHGKLEVVQKGLNAYLEGKRAAFPRFYFLSNDELLEILSETKDPSRVQPHLKKCFEGIQKLKFDDHNKVYGMYSSEGEYVNYQTVIDTNAANGNVDQWLLWTESSMIESVREVTFKSLSEYSKIRREDWVQNRCGMAVLCISMTMWTEGAERAFEGGLKSLEEYHLKLDKEVSRGCEDDWFGGVHDDTSQV